jgi:hypothetical protein
MRNEDHCAGVMRLLERARVFRPELGRVVKYEASVFGELIIILTNGTVKCTALMAADEAAMPNCVPPICVRRIAETFKPSFS